MPDVKAKMQQIRFPPWAGAALGWAPPQTPLGQFTGLPRFPSCTGGPKKLDHF